MTPPSSADPSAMFLYLRTGGGHLAPARAVADALEHRSGGRVRPVLVDGLEHAPRYARYILEEGYRILQARARWYYEFLYFTNKVPAIGDFHARLVTPVVLPWIRHELKRTRPLHIVVAHFLLIRPVLRILRQEGLSTPVSVMVTDPFTAHPLWFRSAAPRFILFSEGLRRHAVAKGIPPERISVHPFVLSPRFSRPLGESEVRAEKVRLGFHPERPLVLILGGADGIPRGARILRVLARGLPGTQLAIVCGRNEALRRAATRIRDGSDHPELTVFGYVDFAYELINCADVVISKCGASTFMEILLLGRVPVVTDYLWEQEKGNKDFLVRSGAGFFVPKIRRLAPLVADLLSPDGPRSLVQERIRALNLRNGAPGVAAAVLEAIPGFGSGAKPAQSPGTNSGTGALHGAGGVSSAPG